MKPPDFFYWLQCTLIQEALGIFSLTHSTFSLNNSNPNATLLRFYHDVAFLCKSNESSYTKQISLILLIERLLPRFTLEVSKAMGLQGCYLKEESFAVLPFLLPPGWIFFGNAQIAEFEPYYCLLISRCRWWGLGILMFTWGRFSLESELRQQPNHLLGMSHLIIWCWAAHHSFVLLMAIELY